MVTKLFNIIQPDLTFFGQKDIQQCLLLRRMVSDLHLPHPPSASHLRIIPTVRDFDNVALSSRNAYMSSSERRYAPVLYRALKSGEQSVADAFASGSESFSVEAVLASAQQGITDFLSNLLSTADPPDKVDIQLKYIKVNDPLTLKPMDAIRLGEAAVLSGAVTVGRTRLIDNLLINIQL